MIPILSLRSERTHYKVITILKMQKYAKFAVKIASDEEKLSELIWIDTQTPEI